MKKVLSALLLLPLMAVCAGAQESTAPALDPAKSRAADPTPAPGSDVKLYFGPVNCVYEGKEYSPGAFIKMAEDMPIRGCYADGSWH